MSDTDYIFEQTENLHRIGVWVVAAIFAFGLINLMLHFLKVQWTNSQGEKINRLAIGVVACIASLLGLYGLKIQTRYERGIKNRMGKVLCVTTRKFVTGKSTTLIEYHYVVNGLKYKNSSGIVYGGDEITGIIVPNGRYQVVFDTLQPQNSIMNFRVTE